MKERENRDQLVVATKFSFHYKAHTNAEKNPANNNFWGNHKRSMYVSVRDSLAKLQTEWVDILYVHWWDFTTSIEEVMDSLHLLVQQGKVLYLGISDSPAWVVSAANEYARSHGKTPFSIYQGQWNVMLRDFERDIIPMAKYYGMALAPWGVLGSGKFQTAKQLEERKKNSENLRGGLGGFEQDENSRKMSEALAKVAAEHGIESVTAIALAYVMSKTDRVYPIVGGRKVEHLQDNIKALSIKLTPEQIEHLESQKPFDLGFPGSMIGQDPKLTNKSTFMLQMTGHYQF